MAAETKGYTEEEFSTLADLYTAHCLETEDNTHFDKVIEDFNKIFKTNKTERSVRGVLIRRGIYNPEFTPKPYKRKTAGPSKKDLLNELEDMAGFDTTSLQGATKEGLQQIINVIKTLKEESDSVATTS